MIRTRMIPLLTFLPAALWLIGCGGEKSAAGPAVGPAAGVRAAESKAEVVATVNGQPIYMGELVDLMMAGHGLEMSEQLIASAVVDQMAEREGVTATAGDVEAENNLTLSQIAPNMPAAEQLRMLDELLKRRNISLKQWNMVMRRNAVLRKIADRRLVINEAMLTAEFNRQYGAKALVRHVQCSSMADAMHVLDLLDKQMDFAELAEKVSTNAQSAAEGGLIRPFTLDTPEVPSNFRQAAFMLNEGQISEVVQVGKDFHVIKLEKMLPPADVRYEDVKEALRVALREQLLTQMQAQLLQELIRTAEIQFHHTTLKEQARTQKPAGSVQ